MIENRITKTSMLVNYFTEDGLIKNTGISKSYWDFVIFKELMDNALDAVEPEKEKNVCIHMDTDENRLRLFDNGRGISVKTINDIYDFSFFVSGNRDYVTPSRGKQGNGLKTIISICYLMGYRMLCYGIHQREQ